MIYHITDEESWLLAVENKYYLPVAFEKEGFIHTSYLKQVDGVLERYYKNKPGLLLLHIDESKVIAEIKYEIAPSINEIFPHIYGKLNIDAVIKITPIK